MIAFTRSPQAPTKPTVCVTPDTPAPTAGPVRSVQKASSKTFLGRLSVARVPKIRTRAVPATASVSRATPTRPPPASTPRTSRGVCATPASSPTDRTHARRARRASSKTSPVTMHVRFALQVILRTSLRAPPASSVASIRHLSRTTLAASATVAMPVNTVMACLHQADVQMASTRQTDC